jgi:hypothetical protein
LGPEEKDLVHLPTGARFSAGRDEASNPQLH